MTERGRLLRQLQIDPDQREDHADSRRGRRRYGTILLALVLASGAAAFFVLRHGRFDVETAVAVAPSGESVSTAILQATGYVTARRQATVSAQITGMLREVSIEEGEHVTAGQVLARLEDSAQQAALAQARAQVQAAQAQLGQYEAQLEQARRDFKRKQDLFDRRLVSTEEFETSLVQVETWEAQVASQSKQIELAQAAVQAAEVQLNYTMVRAPFSGVIVAKTAQAGEVISPSSAGGGFTRTGVGTIVDMESLEIEVDVNEAYINRIKPKQPAQATLDAYPDWTIPARVLAIIPTADRNKATVKVRVAIREKDPRILPDMGVKVSFLGQAVEKQPRAAGARESKAPDGVLVPGSSIVERAGKSVVFTVAGDRAHAAPVTPGQTFGDLRLIEGIANGTTVVRAPPEGMEDGDYVRKE